MSTAPGWYPDPAPESAPGSLRWWDGQRWTEQIRSQPAASQGQTVPVGLTKPVAGPVAHAYQGPVAAPVPPVPLTHTPDGMALAGAGKRLGAFLLDGLI